MDITWYGQSSFKIKGKLLTIVIDPYDPNFTGLKLPSLEAQVVLSTHPHGDHNFVQAVSGEPLIITGPGEYEKLGVTILGINSYHDQSSGGERGKNTIYHISLDGINIVHLGDLGHLLTDEQTNLITLCDVLMVPVGGVYTITAEEATQVVVQLEPKIVIPMHYKIPSLKFDLSEVGDFLKAMGAQSVVSQPKLSITKDKLPEETQVVVLSKS